jgi:PIN domain nuclease of toxin-antitoxin system
MRLLLDTHVVLWWLSDHEALSDQIKDMIDTEVDVFVSAATIWEVGIKQAAGKLGPADLPEKIVECELRELPIAAAHALTAARLPAFHRDPFDRVLIAQARCEGLTLVTRDPAIQKYEVPILHA